MKHRDKISPIEAETTANVLVDSTNKQPHTIEVEDWPPFSSAGSGGGGEGGICVFASVSGGPLPVIFECEDEDRPETPKNQEDPTNRVRKNRLRRKHRVVPHNFSDENTSAASQVLSKTLTYSGISSHQAYAEPMPECRKSRQKQKKPKQKVRRKKEARNNNPIMTFSDDKGIPADTAWDNIAAYKNNLAARRNEQLAELQEAEERASAALRKISRAISAMERLEKSGIKRHRRPSSARSSRSGRPRSASELGRSRRGLRHLSSTHSSASWQRQQDAGISMYVGGGGGGNKTKTKRRTTQRPKSATAARHEETNTRRIKRPQSARSSGFGSGSARF